MQNIMYEHHIGQFFGFQHSMFRGKYKVEIRYEVPIGGMGRVDRNDESSVAAAGCAAVAASATELHL